MPPKRRFPGGTAQRRRVSAFIRAARQARIARAQRRAEEEESTHGSDHEMEVDQPGPAVEVAPAAQHITAEELVAVITGVLQHQQAQQPPPPPPPVVTRTAASIITDFCRLFSPTFTGESDPILAEKWEEQILKHLEALEVSDDATRIRLATFQFRDAAETWWRSVRDSRDVAKMTWTQFKELFLERFFPVVVQDQRRIDFIHLVQRSMSVSEYETQFSALSRFAPEMVSTGALKCRRFEQGLNPSISQLTVVHAYTDYGRMVEGALRAEKQLADTRRIKGTARTGSASRSSQPQRSQSQSQSSQQQERSRTRDDVVSSGGAQPSRAPQSSATIPGRGSGPRRDITCFSCGRQGHTSAECRAARTGRAASGGTTCFHCGQPGHLRRMCPQLRGQSQAGPSTSQQTGVSVTQPVQQQ